MGYRFSFRKRHPFLEKGWALVPFLFSFSALLFRRTFSTIHGHFAAHEMLLNTFTPDVPPGVTTGDAFSEVYIRISFVKSLVPGCLAGTRILQVFLHVTVPLGASWYQLVPELHR